MATTGEQPPISDLRSFIAERLANFSLEKDPIGYGLECAALLEEMTGRGINTSNQHMELETGLMNKPHALQVLGLLADNLQAVITFCNEEQKRIEEGTPRLRVSSQELAAASGHFQSYLNLALQRLDEARAAERIAGTINAVTTKSARNSWNALHTGHSA